MAGGNLRGLPRGQGAEMVVSGFGPIVDALMDFAVLVALLTGVAWLEWIKRL